METHGSDLEILKTMSLKEIRFQSAIYEIYLTELDYIEDLDLLFEVRPYFLFGYHGFTSKVFLNSSFMGLSGYKEV